MANTDPVRDARHALTCFVREQARETLVIARLRSILADAEKRHQRAVAGEIACRAKLHDLGAK